MTLRQSSISTNGGPTAWPAATSRVVNPSTPSPSTVTSVTHIDLRGGSETNDQTSNNKSSTTNGSKKHQLVDQKRRQWAEERAETEEWYPFGRPGGGAPLKSPTPTTTTNGLASQQRLRRLNHSLPSDSCYSESSVVGGQGGGGTSTNGSTTEFGYVVNNNTSLPAYCQLNSDNLHHHSTNGGLPRHPAAQESAAPSDVAYYGASGYFGGGGVIQAQIGGAMVGQSGVISAHHYQHPPPSVLPGVVNGSSTTMANHTADGGGAKHFALVSPYYPSPTLQHPQQYYAYATTPPSQGQVPHEQAGFHVLAPSSFVAPPGATAVPLLPCPLSDSSVVSAGRNSLTQFRRNYYIASSASPQAQPEPQRSNQTNGGGGGSYTEHWANQLPLWQENESTSRESVPPPPRPSVPNGRAIPDSMNSPPQHPPPPQPIHFSSPIASSHQHHHPVFVAHHQTLTPVVYGQQQQHPMAMAWVTPVQQGPPRLENNLQRVAAPQQHSHPHRTAVISPMHSKAPSLSGNETLDGSIQLQFMSASFSGSMPADDSGIHRRRSNLTGSRTEHELDEKQLKILETKMALEEQLVEKRRKQRIEDQREQREFERAERERRLIEQREAVENEHERSKWKKLADQEEKREELIMGPLQRAQEEARQARHAKLHRHASRGRNSESDGYESMSPPAHQLNANGYAERPAFHSRSTNHRREQQQQQEEEEAPTASSTSSGPTTVDSAMTRSQSLPPSAPVVAESPGDDRPIRPLTKDPLKIWEELGYAAVGEENGPNMNERKAPVRQSLRKSRSTIAAKVEASRRTGSLERRKPIPQTTTTEVVNVDESKSSAHAVLQNGKPSKPKAKAIAPPPTKDDPWLHNGSFHDRLKSAGLISNATFIIDSKLKDEDSEKPEKKSERGRARIVSKKRTARLSDESVMPNDSPSDSAKPTESVGEKQQQPKLLDRRATAEKPLLPPTVNDNPWGNTLGGLNPLLQPIVTRRRKPRPSVPGSSPTAVTAPTTMEELERKLLHDTTIGSAAVSSPKRATNGTVRQRADSLSDLSSTPTTENDSNNNEQKKKAIEPSEQKPPTPSTPKSTYTRAPSLDRFNARSPLYGSISSKMKRPTEYQSKMMEQLSLLRQQLKKKQKEVEDGLSSSPSQDVSNSSTRA